MFGAVVERGTLLTVGVLIICVLGIVAATRIPIQMIPDLDVRVISVRTIWPGATPQDVEKEILIEQEEYLRNLPNLSRITATASSGRAEIELEFPYGTEVTDMLIRVNNALNQVPGYPENVDEPRLYASSFSSNSFMFFILSPLENNPRDVDMDLMLDFAEDNVRPRMSSVTGVSEIGIWGGAERQIQILIDPAKLAERNLSLVDVRSAIRSRNQDRSGGEIESGKRRYLLRTIGRFSDMEALDDLVLAQRGDTSIRLRDVASVRLDHSEKDNVARVDGQDILFVTVRREAGSNVIDIKRSMLAEIERINAELLEPVGLRIRLLADDVGYVESSVANVWTNLALGALLATMVMYLFLRSGKTTLIGVLGIPICTIAAFLGLSLAGRTINVISLAGVAFAIGMTLDNSIVVLESIELERRRGKKALQAAIDGVGQVWAAVLASTMTTVLVFLPVAFVAQEAGQLYSDIAIAISASIMASMLVAISVVPAASARLKIVPQDTLAEPVWQRRMMRPVKWILSTRGHRWSVVAITVGVSSAILVFLTPPAEYLPEGEEPKVFASMNAPPGYNLESMIEIAKDLEAYFLPFIEDDPEAFISGESEVPAMRYVNIRVRPEQIRIISEPKDHGHTNALMEAIAAKYREYPGMRAFASRGSIITSNNGGTRSINLDISGSDLLPLYEAALASYRRAQEVFGNPRIQTNPSSLTLAQPMVEVLPYWDRAAELGLDSEGLGLTVAALTDGSYIDEFFMGDDKIDIYLYSEAGQNAELGSLAHLPVYTPQGSVLPLSAIAEIKETVGTSSLRRVNGRRTVTLNIIPPDSIPLETGVQMVKEQVVASLREQGVIPSSINIAISGAADQLDATRDALAANYLVALFIVYLLLVAIFNHWGYPLLIMTSIPLGVAGGVVGLWLMNTVGALLPSIGMTQIRQPFDMISMLGFLILMGTVVNNPILIVDRAVSNIKQQGMAVVDAVTEAVSARLRPIAMSTITTICGLAPLVLVPGAGTELYRGVGVIVMFGILGAAFVTLTMLPALTAIVLQWVFRAEKTSAS